MTEIKDTTVRHKNEGDAPHSPDALSKEAFANPKEFLQVLKSRYADIAENDDGMSQKDLIFYAEHGADPKAREAAAIAAAHFDELVTMPQTSYLDKNVWADHRISSSDLDTDIAFTQGKIVG